MTEFVMPDPPEGMHWRVDVPLMTRLLSEEPRMRISLRANASWWRGAYTVASETIQQFDPESNAYNCVAWAVQILIDREKPERVCDVNGLRGATLGNGVIGG